MADEKAKKKAMDIEKQLRIRRPLKSIQTNIPRPYFSDQEALKGYEDAATYWLQYLHSLSSDDSDYRLQGQYFKNAQEDLRNAKKLAYTSRDKERIKKALDNLPGDLNKFRTDTATEKENSLEKRSSSDALLQRTWAYLSIISLAAALLSISLKWTGSVVGPSSTNTKWIGLCLFLLGCMFTLFYFRAKRK
jgi:hypothetical protein